MDQELISIGMLSIHGIHSAVNIKCYVEKCFEEFDLSLVQVYGYTTDNGGNVLKTTRERLTEQDILLMTTHIESILSTKLKSDAPLTQYSLQ